MSNQKNVVNVEDVKKIAEKLLTDETITSKEIQQLLEKFLINAPWPLILIIIANQEFTLDQITIVIITLLRVFITDHP